MLQKMLNIFESKTSSHTLSCLSTFVKKSLLNSVVATTNITACCFVGYDKQDLKL